MDIRHTATTCPYCGCGCGLTLETAEGRIQRSVPTPDSPVNRGKLCVKGWNVHEFIQHPDRLKRPCCGRSRAGSPWTGKAPSIMPPGSWPASVTSTALTASAC